MTSHKHQEDHIKKALKNMPDVDHLTDKDELYQRISTKMYKTKKKRRNWVFLPAVSTVFIGLIMFIVVMNSNGNYIVQNDQLKEQASFESAAIDESANDQAKTMQKNELSVVRDHNELIVQAISDDERIILGKIFDTKADYVIPVSFVLPNDQAKNSIKEQIQTLTNDLSTMFHGNQYRFRIDEENVYRSGQIPPLQKTSYKLYRHPDNQIEMLVPSAEKGDQPIVDALKEMKNNEEISYIYPTIPSNVSFTIEKNEKNLHIYFDESSSIENSKQYQTMIEAMLSTAKSYGYTKVMFKNLHVDRIGTYNLSEPIQVPEAINPIRNLN